MSYKIPLFINGLFYKIIVLILSTICTTILCLKESYGWGGFAAIITLICLIRLIQYQQNHIRKITFLLEAVENNDHAYNFPTKGEKHPDFLIHNSLNRINKILYQTKQEIAQKEKYYEMIMNMINTGIMVVNQSGYIEEINPKALELLNIELITHLRQLDKIDKEVTDTFTYLTPNAPTQINFTTSSGKTSLSIHLVEIRIQEKQLRIFSLNNIQDELDKKETEAWVKLTRIMNHEIMNSISPVVAISENILSTEQLPCETKEKLELINTTSKGILDFVNVYRQFTNLPVPQPALFDIHPFIQRMVSLASYQAENKNISIEIHTRPEDLILHADEKLISLVLMNLLKNAIEAIEMRDNPSIQITTTCNEKEIIRIEIKNNGSPIPKEIAEQIFVPFFTTKNKGNGIGLSLSRQIMYSSGGNLYLKESSSENGTTFVMEFN